MNFRFIIYISFIWLLMCFASSCKTVKRAVSFGERQDLSLSELVDSVKDRSVVFDELYLKRVFVDIKTDERSLAGRANILIKMDSVIIISVIPIMGIELYRIKLDKEGVHILDRLNKKYLFGTYDRAGSIFLLDLGYNEIESVLVNNIFLAGGIDFYELGNRGRLSNGDSLFHYSFTGKSVSRGTSFFQRIEIQPLTYRPVMTIVNFPDLNIDFKVEYSDFSKYGDYIFPRSIKAFGRRSTDIFKLELSYSTVEFNSGNSVTFSIPANYVRENL
jgi:hypothetical protein